jgi:hypothetical protein
MSLMSALIDGVAPLFSLMSVDNRVVEQLLSLVSGVVAGAVTGLDLPSPNLVGTS